MSWPQPKPAMNTLISTDYLRQNQHLHRKKKEGFGSSGHKQAERVLEFARELRITSILDYGCGKGTLCKQLKKIKANLFMNEYDPAVPKKSQLPRPADLVVCTDVMEHIEPDRVHNVLRHICQLSKHGAYFAIATRAANKILPNGKNAHLIIEGADWWEEQMKKHKWIIHRVQDIRKGGTPDGPPHEVRFWIRKHK